MAVRVLDAELAEAVRGFVDRVVDGRPALLHLRVHGICIVDAIMIAGGGAPQLAGLAAGGFILTLAFQRIVPGT